MATYPTLPTMVDSTVDVDAGMDVKRATNGALKIRAMFSADKRTFKVRHLLTSTQKSTLDTFYGTNKLLDVSYVWPMDGVTYTVRFAGPPQYRALRGPRVEAEVKLEEV